MAFSNVSQADAIARLPECFSVQLLDDSLAPRLLSGDEVFFKRADLAADIGDRALVLLQGEENDFYARVLQVQEGGVRSARVIAPGFKDVGDIDASGLVVVGVYVGHRIETWERRETAQG